VVGALLEVVPDNCFRSFRKGERSYLSPLFKISTDFLLKFFKISREDQQAFIMQYELAPAARLARSGNPRRNKL
jgi:hypothetical protein